MARGGDGPQRMCVGCRRVRPKAAMIRLVGGADASLWPEPGPGLGRGAYLCRQVGCVELALRRRAFRHALRREIDIPPREVLMGRIQEEAERRVLRLIGLARRARKVVSGKEALEAALRTDRVRVLVLARDAGPEAARLAEAAARRGIPALHLAKKSALGDAIGAAPRTAVGVEEANLARGILRAWEGAAWTDGTAGPAPERGRRE